LPGSFGPLGERDDLPAGERIRIENLSAPVDIVRDHFGRPHIYATTTQDAMRAQGYLIARDRSLQLEIFRRLAEGRMAEILALADKGLIDVDIVYRHIGLARVAKAQYDALPEGELRQILDAYADGVSQYFQKIRSGEASLPEGILGIPSDAFTDWSGVDSLAVGRLQTHLLSYTADGEIGADIFLNTAKTTFSAADPDPLVAVRAGIERDMLRFAPKTAATTTTGYPGTQAQSIKSAPDRKPGTGARTARPHVAAMTEGYRRAMQRVREMLAPHGFGSNNWAIAPVRSGTGNALIASDPHLPLNAPSIFWPVSLEVRTGDSKTDLKVAGVAFPGIPGIILGHNEHIGWGATVAGYDVSDVYAETLTPDGKSVVFNGQPVAIETVDEVIAIQGGDPYTYPVKFVPHHGPIQPVITPDHRVAELDPAAGALSIRWTGLEATGEYGAVFELVRARDVDEARQALNQFGVGAQNWMIGDTSGSILWTSHAAVPIRDPRAFSWNASTYDGRLPCFVLPGDGTAEWTGYLPDDLVPWEKNPPAGYIATANNDPIGDTLDNDPSNNTLPDGTPMYLQCAYDIGFRQARIKSLIESHLALLAPEDLAAIQGDVRSAMGAAMAPRLADAITRAEHQRTSPGMHPDLAGIVSDPAYDIAKITQVKELLIAWGTDADYTAASGIDPDTNTPLALDGEHAVLAKASQATLVFNMWLVRMIERTFGDELDRMQRPPFGQQDKAGALLHLLQADPPTLATYHPATLDSALWDDLSTPELETRHERMARALLDALTTLQELAGPDLASYRWGAHHTITLGALIPLFGTLSIPPAGDAIFPSGFPRHGDLFAVDASDFSLSADLATVPDLRYGGGPAQRFVVDMAPSGPTAYNAIAGGNIWDATSPHFRDEAELWRKNQTHAVPFLLSDVVAAAEIRIVAAP
jgi:penicillin amidase